MTTTTPGSTSGSTAGPKKAPWQLIAIIAVTFIPLIAAYVAYYTGMGVPDESVNEGILLSPAPSFAALAELEGDSFDFAAARKWRLVVPVPEACEEDCKNNFYITRQVHMRLGPKAERVERYAVNLGGSAGDQYLQSIRAEHPDLKMLTASATQWQDWLDAAAGQVQDAQHHYLLVDPQGYAMMAYTEKHTGNQLLNDIKRILRYSPEN